MPRKRVDVATRRLAFNGTSDFLTIPVTPSSVAFSVSFWIWKRRNQGSGTDRILDCTGGGPANGFDVIQPTGSKKLQFSTYAASQNSAITTDDLELFRPYHIVCTFNSSGAGTAKIYQDTVLKGTDASCSMGTVASTFTMGKRATASSNYGNFMIADFQFFNGVELTDVQIQDLYSNGTARIVPTVRYDFDGDVNDKSSNGNNATLTGGYYEYEASSRISMSAKSAYVLNFAGTASNRLVISDTQILRPEATNKFTWSYWVYLFKTNNNVLPRLLEKGSHYTCIMGDQTVLTQHNRMALEVAVSGSVIEYWGSTRIQPLRWYFLATTFDDGVTTHYINGVPDVTTVINNPNPYASPLSSSSGSDLKVGNSSGSDRNFPGYMSDIRYHNRVLTKSEISKLMEGFEVTNGLVGKWSMTEGTGSSVADTSGNGNNGVITGATWQAVVNNPTLAGTRTVAGTRVAVS